MEIATPGFVVPFVKGPVRLLPEDKNKSTYVSFGTVFHLSMPICLPELSQAYRTMPVRTGCAERPQHARIQKATINSLDCEPILMFILFMIHLRL
jgi:hypothetical protein